MVATSATRDLVARVDDSLSADQQLDASFDADR
jgi:hypothetical protein